MRKREMGDFSHVTTRGRSKQRVSYKQTRQKERNQRQMQSESFAMQMIFMSSSHWHDQQPPSNFLRRICFESGGSRAVKLRRLVSYLMESQLADENKGHDVDKSDISSPNERLYSRASLSSSSEQSSDFEEPSEGEKFEAGGAVSKDEELDQMTNQPGGESTLQSPPTQTMERPPDSSESRIPSYVFARNKSGNPGDWSITSNESLFSIQMGTTSFTHDQFSWLMKSGELNGEGYKNLDPHHPTSEDLHAFISSVVPAESPSEPTGTEKSTDFSTAEIASTSTEVAAVNVEGDPGAESAAGDRKREPEVEIDHNSNTKSSPTEEQTRHSARGSDASGQSFAIPLLVGDVDGGGSVKSGRAPQEKSQTQPPQETSSVNADPVHAETGEAAQSPSWISRCISFCSCR